jgi:diguanylate cyclase (GGDEF)-like protein/PAS domain S-box-containing protein
MNVDLGEPRDWPEELTDDRYLLDTLMERTPDQVYFKDDKSRFVRISRGLANRLGLADPAVAIGKSDFDYFSDEHAHAAFADEQHLLQTGEPLVGIEECETWEDGRVAWVSTTKVPLRDRSGKMIGLFGISRDITERKLAAERLAEQADLLAGQARALQEMTLVDELTGLHNRRGLQTIGEQALTRARREGNPVALLFLDLDGFKQINDSFGHGAGDDALRAIAGVLRAATRQSDIAARVGGDEFCVLLFTDAGEAARRVAARIEDGILAIHELHSFPFTLSASIGACEVDAKTPGSLEEMLSRADGRMYEHKTAKQLRPSPALEPAG